MYKKLWITEVHAREILDSRGNPTIQSEVIVAKADGQTVNEIGIGKCIAGKEYKGVALVPSGASTGKFEAVELRDGEPRYFGLGVSKAVQNVNTKIREALIGKNALNQREIDRIMLELDGTENKTNLGANAILSVSMACTRACANALGLPLYQYLGGSNSYQLPVPMMNILNGGKHADNAVDFQEFMIMPIASSSFAEGLRVCAEVYHNLKKLCNARGLSTGVGDEGGFAPSLKDTRETLQLIVDAIKAAGYKPGIDIKIAMDAAASELYDEETGMYYFPGETQIAGRREINAIPDHAYEAGAVGSASENHQVVRSTDEMIAMYEELCQSFPIVSIEDGLNEEDWDGWKKLNQRLGEKIQLVGDDLFVTNTKRLDAGIKLKVANAILIKVNQIGTVTEAMDAIEMAHKNGYKAVISHRSGETEDTYIADLAVAVNSGQIKAGAPCRSDRVAKYNRLLQIEEELGKVSCFKNPFNLL